MNERIDAYDVMHLFERVLPQEEDADIKIVKQMGNDLYAFMDTLGACREISLAKTKLEEAIMWTVKGISS